MLWDLYQQYQIGQIGRQLEDVRESAAALEGSSDLRAAARLDEKVNRLALICRAMFELMQASSGITEDQLKAKIVEIDVRPGRWQNDPARQAVSQVRRDDVPADGSVSLLRLPGRVGIGIPIRKAARS